MHLLLTHSVQCPAYTVTNQEASVLRNGFLVDRIYQTLNKRYLRKWSDPRGPSCLPPMGRPPPSCGTQTPPLRHTTYRARGYYCESEVRGYFVNCNIFLTEHIFDSLSTKLHSGTLESRSYIFEKVFKSKNLSFKTTWYHQHTVVIEVKGLQYTKQFAQFCLTYMLYIIISTKSLS